MKVRSLVHSFSFLTVAALLLAWAPMSTAGSILVTIDAPGVQASTVSGVTTATFNSLTPGIMTSYNSSIGQYSGQFAIVSPDAYGGANNTNYFAVGAQSSSTSATLNLGQNAAYFGLFWAAADIQNTISLYENSTLVATLNTQALLNTINKLPDAAAYYGNPNNGQDPGEPFVYVNFYGEGGADFNKIVFTNPSTGTGFESDNQSVRCDPVTDPTGIPVGVPEPSSIIILGSGILGLALFRVRSWKRCSSS